MTPGEAAWEEDEAQFQADAGKEAAAEAIGSPVFLNRQELLWLCNYLPYHLRRGRAKNSDEYCRILNIATKCSTTLEGG
jgi:hypothetical protein